MAANGEEVLSDCSEAAPVAMDKDSRLEALEKKVAEQADEITCMKSAMADCLRRLQTIETAKLQPVSRQMKASSMTSLNSPRPRTGPPSRPRPAPTSLIDTGRSPRPGGSSGGGGGPGGRGGGDAPGSAGPRSSRLHASSSLEPHAERQRKYGPRSTSSKNPKDPTFIKDEGILRIYLRGRAVNMYAPSSVENYDVKGTGEVPDENLKLEWVFGYRGRDCRNNVFYLPTGEVVYFVAAVVVLYNVNERVQRHYLGHNDDVKSLAVHPDRVTIASGQVASHDRSHGKPHVRIWNSVNLNTLHVIGMGDFERAVACMAFSKVDGGDLLCVVDEANEHIISVWEWQKAHKITETKCSTEPVIAVDFSPLDKNVIVSCGKGHLGFWNLDGVQLSKKQGIFEKYDKPKFVLCSTFAENGDLITGDSNGNLFVWTRGTNRIAQAMLSAHEGPIFSVSMTRDGKLVSGGGRDRRIIHWDSSYNRIDGQETVLPARFGPVRVLCPSSSPDMLLVGTTKNCLLQVNLGGSANASGDGAEGGVAEANVTTLVEGHSDELWALASHPAQHQFLTAAYEGTLTLWDALTRQAVWTKDLCADEGAHSVAFHPSGEMAAVGLRSGKWMLMDLTTREKLAEFTDAAEQAEAIQFSPDGTHVAVGSRDNNIYVYKASEDDPKSFARVGKCSGHSSFVLHVDWSSDGQFLRTNSGDYEILFWSSADCKQVPAASSMRDVDWAAHTCTLGFDVAGIWPEGADGTDVNACARSSGRKLLASADDFGKVNLFKYPACQPRSNSRAFTGHSSHVTGVSFLHDDSRLISVGGKDTAIMQWEIV